MNHHHFIKILTSSEPLKWPYFVLRCDVLDLEFGTQCPIYIILLLPKLLELKLQSVLALKDLESTICFGCNPLTITIAAIFLSFILNLSCSRILHLEFGSLKCKGFWSLRKVINSAKFEGWNILCSYTFGALIVSSNSRLCFTDRTVFASPVIASWSPRHRLARLHLVVTPSSPQPSSLRGRPFIASPVFASWSPLHRLARRRSWSPHHRPVIASSCGIVVAFSFVFVLINPLAATPL